MRREKSQEFFDQFVHDILVLHRQHPQTKGSRGGGEGKESGFLDLENLPKVIGP
jgi:hypothetical protein